MASLVGVEKANLVGGCLPGGINTEGVGVARVLTRILGVQHEHLCQPQRLLLRCVERHVGVPVGSEYVERFGKDVVVDKT